MTGYVYLDEGNAEAIKIEKVYLDAGDAHYLATMLLTGADNEGIFDEDIDCIYFDRDISECELI